MRFSEINIFGVYVSPVSVILLAAFVLLLLLRRLADRSGLWRRMWHPALASLALYVMIASALVIGSARLGGGMF